jgi:iron complex transport system substrate-binding protein
VGIAGMFTTDVKAILPSSILNLPVVGDTDTAPNMELIIQLQPDLVLASQRLTDGNRKTLEDAGIAVLEDSQTGSRRNQYMTNLGLILNAQQRVNELLSYEEQYWNLVQTRVANLQRSQKPLVYFEWYKAWFSTGPGGSYTRLIEAAGGINMGENATVSSPQLTSEFVLEQNPDFIIRMLDYTSGEDLTAFQNLHSSILSRPGVSELKATVNGKVYVIKSTLLVERDIVGLLYFAKWFHPDLFADIDPAAVHAEMIQKYFGATVQGVYLYP